MRGSLMWVIGITLLVGRPTLAQTANDPFESPIPAGDDVIVVDFVEFAVLPDIEGDAARMMHLAPEPGTGRLFVSDMRGLLYRVTPDGDEVTLYLDLRSPTLGLEVESGSRERGMQGFALHPEFGEPGADGFGRFYTWTDTSQTGREPDFRPSGDERAHDTVLHEWTASGPAAAVYDGGPPRELMRFEQPFRNHNGGQLAFNPLVSAGDADFGNLYVGSADGGSGGDPFDMAQDLGSGFGKILRIDPVGSDSANGQYGIPADNPFVDDDNPGTLGEIYASGVRNPQRFAWDAATGDMFVADIGQNIVEEVSRVTSGANLGWNTWEGSFRFISRQEVSLVDPRGEAGLSFPVVEYGQLDPLLQPRSAAGGLVVNRSDRISQLADLLIFADMPSGEIFYVPAEPLPQGGQDAIRRILLNDNGTAKTVAQLVLEKNVAQGKDPAVRVDLRFGTDAEDRIFLLNKADGIIRLLVPREP